MWIVLCDPILNKKLLNEGICGLREQCMGPTEKNVFVGKCAKHASQMKA